MEVELAKTAGFCFGVKRAVNMVYDELKKGGKVYTFGPIIHNDQVVSELTDKGVVVLQSIDQLKAVREGTVIIRSHGAEKEVFDIIRKNKIPYADGTCPYVTKIHQIVKEQANSGKEIIIIGNEEHPEVKGIKSWCNDKVTVISSSEEAKNYRISKDQKVCIVSQTTFNYNKFDKLVEIIEEKGYDILVLNTICNATEERQAEAVRLSAKKDAMVVIGSKHSSNTQKLYEICKKECEDTYYIQTLSDLDLSRIKLFHSVGITAGASTPNNIIKEVQIACQK